MFFFLIWWPDLRGGGSTGWAKCPTFFRKSNLKAPLCVASSIDPKCSAQMGWKRSTRRDFGFSIFAKICRAGNPLNRQNSLLLKGVQLSQVSLFHAFKLPEAPLRIWTVSRWTSASPRILFPSKLQVLQKIFHNSGVGQNYLSAFVSVSKEFSSLKSAKHFPAIFGDGKPI